MYILKLVWFLFSLGKYPEMKLLGHMATLFLIFILFSIMAVPTYIPTNNGQGFCLLHILTSICCFSFFDDRHSDKCEVISYCGLDLHFPDD